MRFLPGGNQILAAVINIEAARLGFRWLEAFFTQHAAIFRNAENGNQAVGTFLGAARRFQVHGTVKQVTVVDDYAHHPTEIAALLDAARRRYPQSTVRVIFQPHLFSRTKFFAHEFAEALAKADDVIVTGIFPAREKQEDFPEITAATIVDAAAGIKDAAAGEWIQPVEDMGLAARMMAMRAHHGDVIFTVGAGLQPKTATNRNAAYMMTP